MERMPMPKLIALAVLMSLIFACPPKLTAGPIEDQLEAAKAEHDKLVSDARQTLITAFDVEVKRVASTGKLDATLAAKKELQDFQDSAKLSKNSRSKPAIAAYRAVVERAKKKLIESNKTAITEYTKALDLENAQLIKQQLKQLELGEQAQSSESENDSGMPADAESIPTVRQFVDLKRAAAEAVANQGKQIAEALDQRLNILDAKPATSETTAKIEALRVAREKFNADGIFPDLADVQTIVRQTRTVVDAANGKAEKAADRAIAAAKSRKADELVAWLEVQRGKIGSTLDWPAVKGHVQYEHFEPNFSRASYAPYIDTPPTRLLDGEINAAAGLVGWQGVKPNLIMFTFDRVVRPKAIRMYFLGSEKDGEVNVPKSIVIYDSIDPKTRRKLGSLTNATKTSGWLEVPLSAPGRTFVLDIEKTSVWTILAEVEFK
jgi:chemotaxis protein histidine kinase CheA